MDFRKDPRVAIDPPDIASYQSGATGSPFVQVLEGDADGPTAMISAVVHGNELCGAIILDELLRCRFRPAKGRLFLAFMNVEAYEGFSCRTPEGSRFADEDFNRVWTEDRLDGPGDSIELRRARAIRPLLHEVDYLLDLHSTSSYSAPMSLTGLSERSLDLAQALGAPAAIVQDAGHVEGRRMRDYTPFAGAGPGPTSLLVECGQHWQRATVDCARDITRRFLRHLGMLKGAVPPAPRQMVLQVTDVVTVVTHNFTFAADFQGLESIDRAGTRIAMDGDRPILTPYDNCVLIMPTHGAAPGQTAVRLAREIPRS
ncbi:succinylglutamate desuccinylase [Pacificispira sp.]|uniref:succinylglutamate desuccinylase n=1 Tax=Pacificispira sp. TaxID=2888761 RepID=UPI003BAAE9E0